MEDDQQEAPGYYKWPGTHIPPAAIDYYHENGYVVLTDHMTPSEIESLRTRAKKLMQDFDPSTADTFTTSKESQQKTRSEYFLSSSNKIRCFLEEGRKPDSPAHLSVNKIGHALADKDQVFEQFSRQEKVGVLSRDLGYIDGRIVQSMYICKNAYIGGEVKSHRDGTFIGCEGENAKGVLGYWWALEDAEVENGCLRIVGGSQNDDVSIRMVVDRGGHETRFVGKERRVYEEKEFRDLKMKAGSVVLLHGAVLHESRRNLSRKSRHAYSIHVVDSRDKYGEDNWLQRPEDDPFVGFWG